MNAKTITAILIAACGLARAQEMTSGRIYIGAAKDAPAWARAQEMTNEFVYIGAAKDAPAWVRQVPKASADSNQIAANASWCKWVELALAQERADAQKAWQKTEAVHAEFVADPRNRMLKPEAGGAQLTSQRGIILDYNRNTLSGVISGEDGKRWPFRGVEWADLRDAPKRGLWVDFVPEAETGYALFIYSLPFTAKHLELESVR
jgi:hypothetical protein